MGCLMLEACLPHTMSLPRRAMMEMGFQICCLTCDAPDIPASSRCRGCISSHRSLHERVEKFEPSDPIRQLANELTIMIRNPEKFDHEEEHRDAFEYYRRAINMHTDSGKRKSVEDIIDVFTRQRQGKGYVSLIDDKVVENAKLLSQEIEPLDAPDPRRTRPSRETNIVDRNSRLGEDPELNARVEAKNKSKELPDELVGLFEEGYVKAKSVIRGSKEEVLDRIDDLLED